MCDQGIELLSAEIVSNKLYCVGVLGESGGDHEFDADKGRRGFMWISTGAIEFVRIAARIGRKVNTVRGVNNVEVVLWK